MKQLVGRLQTARSFKKTFIVTAAVCCGALGVPSAARSEAVLIRLAPAFAATGTWKEDLVDRLGEAYAVNELATTLGSPKGCELDGGGDSQPLCLRVIDDQCAARAGAPVWVLLEDSDAQEPVLADVVRRLVNDQLVDYQQQPAGPWNRTETGGACTFEWPRPDVAGARSITSLCDQAEIDQASAGEGPTAGPDPLNGETCHASARRDAGEGVVVGVLDTGVAIDHPDLADRISKTRRQLDVLGGRTSPAYDYITIPRGSSDPAPRGNNRGHGTQIAGIIAASQDAEDVERGHGIRGIAPKAELLPVRMLDHDVSGNVVHAREAVCHAIAEGVDIINASWAFCGTPPDEERFLREAIELAGAEDVLVVAAISPQADQIEHPGFPAGYGLPNVIGVAATVAGYDRQSGTCPATQASTMELLDLPGVNFRYCENPSGAPCDVAAPGNGVVTTTYPAPGFCRLYEHRQLRHSLVGTTEIRGSSLATPYVTGAAAAYLGRCRAAGYDPTAADIREAIFKASAQPPGTQEDFPHMQGFLDLQVLQGCSCPGEGAEITCGPS